MAFFRIERTGPPLAPSIGYWDVFCAANWTDIRTWVATIVGTSLFMANNERTHNIRLAKRTCVLVSMAPIVVSLESAVLYSVASRGPFVVKAGESIITDARLQVSPVVLPEQEEASK